MAMIFGAIGCRHSGSDLSGDSGGSSIPGRTKEDRQAQSAALAELQRHWLKTPDGWTAAVVSGSPYAPEHFLRQYRAFTVDEVKPEELSEADKLNGVDWEGQMTFKPTVCREAGGDGGMVVDGMGSFGPNRQRGRWTEWVDFTPGPMRFQKVKGQWQFKWDGSYLRGTLPGPQDYTTAGVR
jgi:hypothetical protein